MTKHSSKAGFVCVSDKVFQSHQPKSRVTPMLFLGDLEQTAREYTHFSTQRCCRLPLWARGMSALDSVPLTAADAEPPRTPRLAVQASSAVPRCEPSVYTGRRPIPPPQLLVVLGWNPGPRARQAASPPLSFTPLLAYFKLVIQKNCRPLSGRHRNSSRELPFCRKRNSCLSTVASRRCLQRVSILQPLPA